MCGKIFPENEIGWSPTKGYYSYCKPCKKIQEANYRLKKKGSIVSQIYDSLLKMDYKNDLLEFAKKIKVGDIFRYKKGKIMVEKIYPTYVLCIKQYGIRECFVWDDLYRISQRIYKGSEDDE